jgi:hypothetical protein
LKPIRLDADPLTLGSPLPIDLDLIREHCAVDGSEFDTLLTAYLGAAITWAEGQMHRTIFPRPHRWVLREFPLGEIRLPRGQTISVESIEYYADGSPVTITGPSSGSPAGTGWREDLRSKSGGVLAPVHNGEWPTADTEAPAPVTINFTAGYPTGEVPQDITHALLFAVSDMFDTRGSADLTVFGKNMSTRMALISPYKLVRWY